MLLCYYPHLADGEIESEKLNDLPRAMQELASGLRWGIPGPSFQISKTAVAAAADLSLP